MINTYLNDNQSMPYPFYGYGALPFPMCVITGLGICIHLKEGEEAPSGHSNIYANSVSITEDSVTVAICRKPTTGGLELVGVLYARTDGYSTYVPSYVDAAVYENQTILPYMLRYVYAGEANDGVDDQRAAQDMQAFYSTTREAFSTVLSTATSTGFMQIGSIPESAIGNYLGEFYLDPACVTYMNNDIFGHYKYYTAGNMKYNIGQRFNIELGGWLTWKDNTISTKYGVNNNDFIVLPDQYVKRVTHINGQTICGISGTTADAYPMLTIKGHTVSVDSSTDTIAYVEVSAEERDTAVVVTLNGTTAFPNCYKEALNAQS